MQEAVRCVTGIVESSSRRMGNRSKTLLKKGQSLGERAILEGEPAGESCTAGSPVVALIVNRRAAGHACLLSLWSEGRPILKWESVREFFLCRQPCPGPSCQWACHALIHVHSACLLHLCTASMHAIHSVMLLPCLPSGCPSTAAIPDWNPTSSYHCWQFCTFPVCQQANQQLLQCGPCMPLRHQASQAVHALFSSSLLAVLQA